MCGVAHPVGRASSEHSHSRQNPQPTPSPLHQLSLRLPLHSTGNPLLCVVLRYVEPPLSVFILITIDHSSSPRDANSPDLDQAARKVPIVACEPSQPSHDLCETAVLAVQASRGSSLDRSKIPPANVGKTMEMLTAWKLPCLADRTLLTECQ
jgi:hypothetical protein